MNLVRWKSPTSPGSELLDFRYGPLKSFKTGIRLAKIKPGIGNKGIHIDLIDSFIPAPGQRAQQEYDALSYTWGENVRSKNVMCNGRRLAVTPTLLDALQHFRDPDHEIVLWIDQICICQDRVLERNQQVNLMGKIFSGARKVSVWLGPHSNDSRAGMQLARQLLHVAKAQAVGSSGVNHAQLEAHGLPKRGHRKWKALSAILRRPWFWRQWVIQEAVLNPRVELVLGDDCLTWAELESIVDIVEGPTPRHLQLDPTISAWELPFSRINRIRLRHQRQKRILADSSLPRFTDDEALTQEPALLSTDLDDNDELDLLDLLLMSRDFQATEPLDKIYALLGLGRHEITVDYNSTTESVFNEFALHVIGDVTKLSSPVTGAIKARNNDKEVRKALIMLSCAGVSNQNLRDLPSWVPDWTANLAVRPFVYGYDFSAGGDVVEKLDWHYDTGLQLCGKLVDTIGEAGSIYLTYDTSISASAAIERWWHETRQMALERVVRSPGSTMNVDAFQSLCRILAIDKHGYYKGDGRGGRRPSLLVESDVSQDLEHRAQQTLILGPTRGRVLFVTATGYIGLAPFGTQEGDLIYVVLGSGVPYVLRPIPDDIGAFQLVGEAYVQGIMNGEALEMEWGGIEDLCIR